MTTQNGYFTAVDGRGIATLTLHRPEVHNAFDDQLIAALTAELKRLEADPQVRAVVIAATGKSFCAGGDLNWMRRSAAYSFEENVRDALGLSGLMETIYRLEKPTVAKVQGPAYGGGVGVVACCDVAIASRSAHFVLSEVKLGILPGAIGPFVIAAVGQRHAARYFTTAERIDAEEARRIGLVHEVVDPEQLDGRLEALLSGLSRNAPGAMGKAKRLVRDIAGLSIDRSVIEDTAGRIAAARASEEGCEGIAAFLEKRKPRWDRG
jgi:methylglutaconyl-CoA hydratase